MGESDPSGPDKTTLSGSMIGRWSQKKLVRGWMCGTKSGGGTKQKFASLASPNWQIGRNFWDFSAWIADRGRGFAMHAGRRAERRDNQLACAVALVMLKV